MKPIKLSRFELELGLKLSVLSLIVQQVFRDKKINKQIKTLQYFTVVFYVKRLRCKKYFLYSMCVVR